MTALVYTLQPDQICLAMDTLVVDAEDKTALCYQTKFSILPHLNLVIAGTGLASLVSGWFHCANGNLLATGIEDLNSLAPDLFRNAEKEIPGNNLTSSTIYHFGYSQLDNRYVGYALRSTNNWNPERLPDALGFKPVIQITPTDDIRFPDFLIDIIKEQRRQDQLLPLADQVGIGGEIQFVNLENGKIMASTVYQFESYRSDWEQMMRKVKDRDGT